MCSSWFLLCLLAPTLASAELIGENLGDPCEVEEADNIPGKCTFLYMCPYAVNRIRLPQLKITPRCRKNKYKDERFVLTDDRKGDSGGPLMMDIRNNDICGYYVFGIVAHGDVCGKNEQGHYTNIMNRDYLDWISKTVWPSGF